MSLTEPELVDLMEPRTMECPYPAYALLRDDAPVYHDPRTDMYVITRYADVRQVLTDAKRFIVGGRRPHPRYELIKAVYEREGAVIPAPSISGMDNPSHKELRKLYNEAFAPQQVLELETYMQRVADEIIDRFAPRGRVELISEFTIPFPLRVIGHIMGIESEDDLARIQLWTDAWVGRLGWMLTDDEVVRATELEVQAQRFFQPIIDELRRSDSSGGLLGHVVRTVIPEWGRTINDAEAQTACLQSMFVAGSETTTSVFGHAIQFLIEDPSLLTRVHADRSLVPILIEEVLRFEAPAQGMFRRTTEDVELHGVTIPAGAMVNIRFASANRDDREFDLPDQIRLDRSNGARHLGFGQGTHLCLGAALARLELKVGINALLNRLHGMRFQENANDFSHNSNVVVRGLKQLHIEFTAVP